MPGKIRAGSGALLQCAGLELGRALEKDKRRARAADGPGHAPVHRAGDEGRHLDGRQKVRESKQPASRRIQSSRADKLHHVPRRQQPLRMGDEPAFAEERLSLEASYADRRTDHEHEGEFEERQDTGG